MFEVIKLSNRLLFRISINDSSESCFDFLLDIKTKTLTKVLFIPIVLRTFFTVK